MPDLYIAGLLTERSHYNLIRAGKIKAIRGAPQTAASATCNACSRITVCSCAHKFASCGRHRQFALSLDIPGYSLEDLCLSVAPTGCAVGDGGSAPPISLD